MSAVKPPMTLDTTSDENIGAVCIPNISTAERNSRLRFGIIAFAVSIVVLGVLMVAGVDRLWRLPLFLLFAAAASGYFQWHDKTCVGLAAQNSRHIGDKEEKIEDASELAQVKRQASRVQLKAVAAGVVLTLVALVLPVLVH